MSATVERQEASSDDPLVTIGAAAGDWWGWPLPSIIRHLEETHHRFTREALGRIAPLLAEVVERHGEAHSELAQVRGVFQSLAGELASHLVREEQILFPYITALAAGRAPAIRRPIGNPLRALMADHRVLAALLEGLRSLTDSFTPPADACSSYGALYAALAELREDLLVHMALENEVLFPRALALIEPGVRGAAHEEAV